jgi:hypothetical protein
VLPNRREEQVQGIDQIAPKRSAFPGLEVLEGPTSAASVAEMIAPNSSAVKIGKPIAQ